jgi:hypothetical protein
MKVKKNTAGMLLIAFAIYFLHDIIPHHHHHHHHHHGKEHHPVNHDHNDDQKENGLGSIFSLIYHSGDGFIAASNQNIIKYFNKYFDSIFCFSEGIKFIKFEIPPLICYSLPESHQYFEFLTCAAGLRAPPAFIS